MTLAEYDRFDSLEESINGLAASAEELAAGHEDSPIVIEKAKN